MYEMVSALWIFKKKPETANNSAAIVRIVQAGGKENHLVDVNRSAAPTCTFL